MGVFTVTRQVRLGLNLIPPWWLSGASIDLDFRNSRYYDSSLGTGQQPLAPLPSYLSCTRASTGYAKTSTGLLSSFGNNALRITDLGLLIEEARTNSYPNSTDFSGVAGNVFRVTFAASGAGPDGSTAYKITETTGNGNHGFYSNTLGTGTAGQTSTCSIFLKAAERTKCYLQQTDSSSSSIVTIIDLTTGVLSSQATGGSNLTNPVYAVEQYANGWWRVSITATMTAAGGSIPRLEVFMVDGSGNNSYTGDGTSGMLVWGPQVELGGAFSSSYIPTASASVTRAADQVTCIGGLATILKSLPSSVFADVRTLVPVGSSVFGRIFGDTVSFVTPLSLGGADNVVSIYNGTASINATIGNSLTFSGGVKVASSQAIGTGGRSIVGGGGTVFTDTATSTVPTTPSLGTDNTSGDYLNGYMRRAAVWNSKVVDATLQALTAP